MQRARSSSPSAIARRLKEAQNTAAMLTTFNEVDMGAAMALRPPDDKLRLKKLAEYEGREAELTPAEEVSAAALSRPCSRRRPPRLRIPHPCRPSRPCRLPHPCRLLLRPILTCPSPFRPRRYSRSQSCLRWHPSPW